MWSRANVKFLLVAAELPYRSMHNEAMNTNSEESEPATVWTIGHGDRDFDDVARSLAAHGVRTIVDVRSQPYSKYAPDFTKGELEIAAASAGFGYRWLGDRLGGKPPPSEEELTSGLEELAGLVDSTDVALLCAETDPSHCHRNSLLAPALIKRGRRVVHILPDGAAAPYQETLPGT